MYIKGSVLVLLLKGVFLISIYSKELLARAIAKFLSLDF